MLPSLSTVSCKYGAPMGRNARLGACTEPLFLRKLKLTQGYDQGGAYWGNPETVYRAVNSLHTVEVFVRASSRKEAKELVLKIRSEATFIR